MSQDEHPADVTQPRKRHHLELCLEHDVGFQGVGNGLDQWQLIHDALPEVDLESIDLGRSFLDASLELPLIISSMTGGTEEATRINRTLATVASEVGCAMGVGSQRAALERADLVESFRIRDVAPDTLLFANLGAVQLNYGYGLEECMRAVEMIEADGLFLHLNSLQEALQPEGDTNFQGLLEKIRHVAANLPCPLLLKTTGNGMSLKTLRKLQDVPLAGFEVSGAGGTSWARIEAMRSHDDEAATVFGDWGESTAQSILAVRELYPTQNLIASGGVRSGADVAVALALGADVVGLARPLLLAAHRGRDALRERFERIRRELQISCFYAGRARAKDLDRSDLRPV